MEKKTVFICFDPNEHKQMEAFASLRDKSAHSLETHGLYYNEKAADGSMTPVFCPINNSHAKEIREEILSKFGQCSKLVVLIGNDTHKNAWIEWEVLNFHKIKDKLSFGSAWKIIRGMRLTDCEKAVFPKSLESRSTKCLWWEPEALEKWIEE